jgi:hypothetical protein
MSDLANAWVIQQTKVDVNRALDQAAGRILSLDERREWWINADRFLRMLQPHQHDPLMDEARR